MAPIPVLSFLLLVLIFFASYVSCGEPTLNGTTIDWKDNFDDKGDEGSGLSTEYDAKGLQPWYNFVNGFISIVLSKEPYDLLFKVKDGTWDIKDDVALGYGLGLSICAAIGVLFIVIMPIVGWCFCCCRCCGRCGGDMSQKEKENNNCKRSVFGVILLMITLLMFSGVLLTFVCNDRMSDTADEMSKTSKGILNEAILFINRTVGEVEKVLLVDFPFVTTLLSNDISDENLRKFVGDPLLEEIDLVSVKPVEAVQNLSKETKRMRDQLEAIRDNSKTLSQATGELNRGLTESRNNLTEIQNECTSIGQTFCNDIDPSSLASEANFTNLPNVSKELSSVQDVVNQDFEKTAQEVNNVKIVFSLLAEVSSLCICWADEYGKRDLPLVKTRCYPTAVHNLGRDSSNHIPHDMFADCDLSPLCSMHSFTVIPFLSGPTQHEVSREDLVAKYPAHVQPSELRSMAKGLFSPSRQPSERKRKETSASRKDWLWYQNVF